MLIEIARRLVEIVKEPADDITLRSRHFIRLVVPNQRGRDGDGPKNQSLEGK